MEETRISYQMREYGWMLVSDALDDYMLKHIDFADMTDLIDLADYIDSRLGIKNYAE